MGGNSTNLLIANFFIKQFITATDIYILLPHILKPAYYALEFIFYYSD